MKKFEHLFISYDLALKLKQKEFNEPCLACYTENAYGSKSKKIQYFREPNEDINKDFVFIAAPLYQQVFDWFREKHDLRLVLSKNIQSNSWYCHFHKNDICVASIHDKDSYYEVLNEAIEEALKLI